MLEKALASVGIRYKTFDDGSTIYMRKLMIGRFALHVFHRGDSDPDCHDHPWGFATFPLVSYDEEVLDPDTGTRVVGTVRAFRVHRRPATYAHRVTGRSDGRVGPIVTLVAMEKKSRNWGFHRQDERGRLCWMDWRTYLFDGGPTAMCEAPAEDRVSGG
jgi:hypothetical protein